MVLLPGGHCAEHKTGPFAATGPTFSVQELGGGLTSLVAQAETLPPRNDNVTSEVDSLAVIEKIGCSAVAAEVGAVQAAEVLRASCLTW